MKYNTKDLVNAREQIFKLVMAIEDHPRKKELEETQNALKIGANIIAERLLEMRGV